jgi:hypothetical protein
MSTQPSPAASAGVTAWAGGSDAACTGPALIRRALAELVGTALLLVAVVGSGIERTLVETTDELAVGARIVDFMPIFVCRFTAGASAPWPSPGAWS